MSGRLRANEAPPPEEALCGAEHIRVTDGKPDRIGQVGTVPVGTGLGADCTSGYRGGNRRSWTAEPSPIASVGEEMEPHKREVKIG